MLLRLILARHLHLLDRLCLVDASAVLDDALDFILFVRPVVARQQEQLLAFVSGHDGAAVANVGHEALLANNEDHDAAAAAALVHRLLSVGLVDEAPLGLETASRESLRRVFGEARLVDDDQVQLILEEVGALRAAVTIIDGEVAALGPDRHVLPRRGPRHVQDDAHTILVVVSLDALVRVGRVRRDQPVRFRGELRRLEVLERVEDWVRDLIVDVEHLLRGLCQGLRLLTLCGLCARRRRRG